VTTCARCSASSTARRTSSWTRWTPAAPGFAETVEQAQALGYAEADPTADVEGFDAAAKAAILASLAFHTRVSSADVHREGITEVTAGDIQAAKEMDCVVKLLAICQRVTSADGSDAVSVRVHPAMIPRSHPLASVRGCLQRGVRRGHRCRAAHVLRPRRRGRPDGIRRPR
jgi:homoserine dehydrogenase